MTRLVALAAVAVCGFGQTPVLRQWAEYWADRYGVERDLVCAVIEAESGWNPRAVSAAGAVGMMQLMPDTAAAFGVRNRFDAAENIRGGVAYLAWLRDRYGGDRRLMVAAYNAGHGRVSRNGLNASREVHSYVTRVAYIYRRNRWETLIREEGMERE
jgi:soluble lytic murein transglycosylase-like protein